MAPGPDDDLVGAAACYGLTFADLDNRVFAECGHLIEGAAGEAADGFPVGGYLPYVALLLDNLDALGLAIGKGEVHAVVSAMDSRVPGDIPAADTHVGIELSLEADLTFRLPDGAEKLAGIFAGELLVPAPPCGEGDQQTEKQERQAALHWITSSCESNSVARGIASSE